MSKQSNMFQRVILLIESVLASPGARITESLSLKDLFNGTEREIDIAIEIPSGPRTLRVAVECRDRKRPATVEWIDQLYGKYLYLPVDRVVAVSRSGFTKAAQKKAVASNIETLTPEEIVEFDWQKPVPDAQAIVIPTTRYEWTEITTFPDVLHGRQKTSTASIAQTLIYRETSKLITISELLHWHITTDPIKQLMYDTWNREADALMSCIIMTPGWFFKDHLGQEKALYQIIVILKGGIDVFELWLQPLRYSDAFVTYADATIEDGILTVVIVEKPGEEARCKWYYKSEGKYPLRGDLSPWIDLLHQLEEGVKKFRSSQ